MNGNSGRGRGRGPRRARATAVNAAMSTAMITVVTGVALFAAACSGSSSSAAGSSLYTEALAYAQCMRHHGVPNFPDPSSQGQFPPVQEGRNGVTQQTVQSAQNACRSLQPGGGTGSAQDQQSNLSRALNFSKCMRAHGVPNYPDPAAANGGIGYNLSGIDTQSPQYQSAQQVCQAQYPRGGRSSSGSQP